MLTIIYYFNHYVFFFRKICYNFPKINSKGMKEMAYDGIVTQKIASELMNLSGARIDKVFEPDKNTIILGMYLNGSNYALNICIDSQNYGAYVTTDT